MELIDAGFGTLADPDELIVLRGGPAVGTAVLMIGDSIQVGIGVGDVAAQDERSIGTPNPVAKLLSHYANGVGPPPTFIDYPSANTLTDLSLYAASSGQSMGFEMTFGPALAAALGTTPVLIKSAVSGSTLAAEWDPSGTYPASGSGNLYNSTVTLAHTMEASSSSQVAIVFVVLGTNDAISGTNASNFAANIANLDNHLATDFPGCKRVYLKVNASTDPGHAANVSTIRAGLVSALSGNANAAIVEYDDCTLLGDTLHPTTESYLAVGPRVAAAALDLLGVARAPLVTLGATGWGLSWGAGTSGTGALSPKGSGLAKNGHRELLVVATGIVAGTIPAPTSADAWTQIGSTLVSTASGVTEQLAVFTRLVTTAMLNANGGHTSPTTVTPTTTARHLAKIFNVWGPNANPSVDTSQATQPNTFGTGPTTVAALTTTHVNDLVVLFSGGYCGSDPTQSATNGTLANFAKAIDVSFNILTDREILAAFAGTLASASTSGTWSESSTANAVLNHLAIALNP